MSELDTEMLLSEHLLSRLSNDFKMKVHWIYNLTVPDSWNIASRINKDQHLLYVVSGEGWYTIQDERVELRPGKIIFVSNGCVHSAGLTEGNNPHIIPIRFNIYHGDEELSYYKEPFYITWQDYDDFRLHRFFVSLYRDYNSTHYTGYEELLHNQMVNLFIYLQNYEGNNEGIRSRDMNKIRDYLDQQLHGINMSDLSSIFHRSNKQLTRHFKNSYGITPKKYHIQSLIRRSDYLLTHTDMTIEEIALSLGYPNSFSYSKQYKELRGVSPLHRRLHTPQ